jgi:hypothetical protein
VTGWYGVTATMRSTLASAFKRGQGNGVQRHRARNAKRLGLSSPPRGLLEASKSESDRHHTFTRAATATWVVAEEGGLCAIRLRL